MIEFLFNPKRTLRRLSCLNTLRATIKTKSHRGNAVIKSRANNWRDLKIASVVLAGLLIEAFIASFTFHRLDYTEYYVHCIIFRHLLAVYCFIVIIKVQASIRLFAFMTFNFCAIVFSVLYLDPAMRNMLLPIRKEYFAPAYRALEIIIIVSASREILSCLYLLIAGLVSRFYAMVTGRTLHF